MVVLSSDLHQLTKRYVLLILLSVAVVNVSAKLNEIRFFGKLVHIYASETKAVHEWHNFTEQKRNEINDIFKNSTTNEFLINYINDIEIWWKKDIAKRTLPILKKYLANLNTSDYYLNIDIRDLTVQLENGVKAANEFWMERIEKKISFLKKYPNNINFEINKEAQVNLDNYEEFKLPTAELQLQYDTQIKAIVMFTKTTRALAEIALGKLKAEDIFDINNIIFSSELINLERYKSKLREDSFNAIKLTEQLTKVGLNKLWFNNKFNHPTESEFSKVLLKQSIDNFNQLKLIKEKLDIVSMSKSHGYNGLFPNLYLSLYSR